jgi:FkbM family methyltransferase
MNNVFKHLLDENNKIKIPNGTERVKIDVGLSVSAPNSELWLQKDNDLCVFGFEPNKHNVKSLCEGCTLWPVNLKKERINKNFFCIECALSDKIEQEMDFYCTEGDAGTSSLFKPNYFPVKEIIKIPVITLEYFFDFFPWDKIKIIEQIKIDAQSSDLNIIKGIGKYLSKKIVYLDVETTTGNQYCTNVNATEIKTLLEINDFECLKWDTNATFINKKYKSISKNINYIIQDL